MLKKALFALSLTTFFFMVTGISMVIRQKEKSFPAVNWDAKTPVAEVLQYFGDAIPASRPASPNAEDIRMGNEIFTLGITVGPDGKKNMRQSRYYVCTNCHNNVKEDPDLRISDPVTRLTWAVSNKLPFLQGTTMYGSINKVSWYNGDYVKKYGALVEPAHKTIEAAIHLCATVCSQGRDLTEWEMKAMMAYYWSLELKMGDLNLTEADWAKLKTASASNNANPAIATWIKSFYLQGSPATFTEEPVDRKAGYQTGKAADPVNGKIIYQLACMSCHNSNGPSQYLVLDESKMSRDALRKDIARPGDKSLYHLVRHGTGSEPGHEAYMPLFPQERMNDQQVEDLRAFIEGA